jgi:hypothetical protein
MITYKQLTAKNKLIDIAIALGYVKADSTQQEKRSAIARVANWKRTGLPSRVLVKKAEQIALLVA